MTAKTIAKNESANAAAATFAARGASLLVSSFAIYAATFFSAATSSSFDMSARPLMSASFARS